MKEFFSPEEGISRDELRRLQTERLKAIVNYVYEKVPFYREKFDSAGVKPEDIKDISDIQKLPFTTKKDIVDNYPLGLLAVPMRDVVRLQSSSGTTGKNIFVAYTRNDVELWTIVMARSLWSAGVRADDIIQIAYGYGLFTGGLGFHQGAERIGATIIPTSSGNTRRQIQIMQDLGTTVLCCTPSYALYIAEVGREMGVDFENLPLRVGIFGAEPWSEEMRKEIEEELHLDAINIYGLCEIIGPGVASECLYKEGMHINEDVFYPEIINPETGEQLPAGERGELVLTTLTKEAMPLIRYRTRDICSINPEPCKCGRTFSRLSRIEGRTDDMIIVRGINIFPSQIESVLMSVDGVAPHYEIIVDREKGKLDTLELRVEVSESFLSDEMRDLEELRQRLEEALESALDISVNLTLAEPRSIPRSEGKARRVIDKRELFNKKGGERK
ncbi:MAG: phenylacetate--CoA ligase family protein [bacterium]